MIPLFDVLVFFKYGAILEKRYDAHPPSWLVVSAGQQKRFQKLGDFFEDKSSDFGSTSSRGCLISILYHSLCIVCMYLHAIVICCQASLLASCCCFVVQNVKRRKRVESRNEAKLHVSLKSYNVYRCIHS